MHSGQYVFPLRMNSSRKRLLGFTFLLMAMRPYAPIRWLLAFASAP